MLLTQQLQPLPLLLPPLAKTLGFVLQPVGAGDGRIGVRGPVAFLERKREKNHDVTARLKPHYTAAMSVLLLLSEELLWITEAQHWLDSALLRNRGKKKNIYLVLGFFSLSKFLTVQKKDRNVAMTAEEGEAGTDSNSHAINLKQKATGIKLPQSHEHRETLWRKKH